MAQTETLTRLRTRVRRLSDHENSTFVTDSELTDYINSAYSELYDLLVQSGHDYFESTQTITSDGTANAALPTGYRSTKRLVYQTAAGVHHPMKPIPLKEAHLYTYPSTSSQATVYRIAGGNIILYPTPPSGQTYIHTYVPTLTALSLDGDTLDGVSGWEEYIVVDAAIQVLLKEESNPAHLVERKKSLKDRIEYGRADRHLEEFGRIADSDENGYNSVDAADWFPGWWRR